MGDIPETGLPWINIYDGFALVGKAQEESTLGRIPAIYKLFLLLLNTFTLTRC